MIFPGITFGVSANTESTVTRVEGLTRVETSIKVSQEVYADSNAENVVLAGYHGEADALTGTILASEKDAPLLLIQRFDDSIKTELKRLGAKKIYLLGGEQALITIQSAVVILGFPFSIMLLMIIFSLNKELEESYRKYTYNRNLTLKKRLQKIEDNAQYR